MITRTFDANPPVSVQGNIYLITHQPYNRRKHGKAKVYQSMVV